MEKIYNPDIIAKIEYLENAKKYTAAISKLSYKELGINKGQTLLEFGCGSGYDVMKMARIVGAKGRVYGVDIDEETIAYNQDQHPAKNVFFSQSSYPLAFPSAFFDAIRIERVFQHIPPANFVPTLEELTRVLKYKGNLCVIETDWNSLQLFSQKSSTAIEKGIVDFIVHKTSANGFIAREMGDLLLEQRLKLRQQIVYPYTLYRYEEANAFIKLTDIVERAVAHNLFSQELADNWLQELRTRSEKGLFAMQINFIITLMKK